ncbi:MAG TPA: DNA-3-methyladenine glycosylase [Methanothrix sp.]|nr:DNA-3-methyladenine glycosylase [Methanothrix sp.]
MELIIEPLLPFDFSLSAWIFSDGDPRVQRYEGGVYWHALRLGERPVLIEVRSQGTVDDPRLVARVEPDGLSSSEKEAAKSLVSRIFNLDLDLRPFYRAAKGDPVMVRIAERLRGLHSPSTATPFEALIDSITEQQISLRAAWRMQRKLIETFGESLALGGKSHYYYVFPGPERLAAASVEQLRGCGLSGRKAEYVRGVSRLVADGGALDLEALAGRSEDEIIEALNEIRGIGVWTAEMTMIRGMQKFDAFPADDLGLRRVISHYYYEDRRITGAEARSTALQWKGWRGLASFYLIVAEGQELEA